jgi:predicted RNase H-like nuclease (RuvC/YqgF family)
MKYTMSEAVKKSIKEVAKTLEEQNDFFPKDMINVIQQQQDSFIYNEMLNNIGCNLGMAVDINEDKLKKWVSMCIHLDNIPYDVRQDIAINHKLYKLEQENEYLKEEIDGLKGIIEELNRIIDDLRSEY